MYCWIIHPLCLRGTYSFLHYFKLNISIFSIAPYSAFYICIHKYFKEDRVPQAYHTDVFRIIHTILIYINVSNYFCLNILPIRYVSFLQRNAAISRICNLYSLPTEPFNFNRKNLFILLLRRQPSIFFLNLI